MSDYDARATVERLSALAKSFPCLADAPHVDPFEPGRLDAWAAGDECFGAAYFAATFLLHVTDASAHWHSGVFSLTSAMCAWGPEDRCAFLAWAAAPWGGSHDRK